jgi:hypothetical protein
MNETDAKTWMQRLAEETPAIEAPSFEQISARARLEAAFESRRRAEAPLVWIDAACQSLALTAIAALSVWLDSFLS